LKRQNHTLCEQVWGSDDFNPFQIDVTCGSSFAYGSYLSGLPEYNFVEELQPHYSNLKEFSKMAIERRFCNRCRFPWVEHFSKCDCSCGQFQENSDSIKSAELAAMAILDYDRKCVQNWADQMEKDLEGDSEYAQLNRKARAIMGKKIEDYKALTKKPTLFKRFIITVKDIFTRVIRWFSPTYRKWYFTTQKEERAKSIPLNMATTQEISNMSTSKMYGGQCYVRTKTGSVVVIPANMLSEQKHNYEDATLVAPIIKD
jgi:hypothetical protein